MDQPTSNPSSSTDDRTPSDAGSRPRSRRRRWVVLTLYIVALLVSHAAQFIAFRPAPRDVGGFDPDLGATRRFLTLPAMDESGPVPDEPMTLSLLEWTPPPAKQRSGTIILLHGSPGSATNFAQLGPLLARDGYRVIAPDLPGFGESDPWVPRYSILAHAHATLAMLDAMDIARAHVVGWSMGSGVALHMADLRPDALDSITLLAGIGAQETEGSGSYAFERVKYAVQYAGLVVLPEVVPHFGLLGPRETRHALSRNFLDSDQRPLEDIMRSLALPVLVMHGRSDFLVADWAAERHHDLIPTSALVMLDANHFLPFFQPEETAEYLTWFYHAIGQGQPPLGAIVEAPDDSPLGHVGLALERARLSLPWWTLAMVIAAIAVWRSDVAAVVVGLAAALISVDLAVGIVGLAAGVTIETAIIYSVWRLQSRRGAALRGLSLIDWRRRFDASTIGTIFVSRLQPWRRVEAIIAAGALRRSAFLLTSVTPIAALVWAAPVSAIAWAIVAATSPTAEAFGPLALVPVAVLALLGVRIMTFALTWTGRRRLLMHIRRTLSFEFWPATVVYLPVVLASIAHSIRHRGIMLPSCCNPGVSGHGGIIGESKHQILQGLAHAESSLLPAVLIPRMPDATGRAEAALGHIASDPSLGGFPVILKPDNGFRGFALKLARTPDDVRAYFATMHDPAIVQRYHAGPQECGILWARYPDGPRDGRTGFIYAITVKDFPTLTGNGRDSLETLMYRHPRFRLQADVFLSRHADAASSVPRAGERIALAVAGNHCQGTLFRDGAHLITPQLEDAIDRIARGFPDPEGDGLDIGRFDVRYSSSERFARGEDLAIVELNGSTGEPTNIYDPKRSTIWAYRVLLGHVRLLHELGAMRRDQGVRPASLAHIISATRTLYQQRTGSSMSD